MITSHFDPIDALTQAITRDKMYAIHENFKRLNLLFSYLHDPETNKRNIQNLKRLLKNQDGNLETLLTTFETSLGNSPKLIQALIEITTAIDPLFGNELANEINSVFPDRKKLETCITAVKNRTLQLKRYQEILNCWNTFTDEDKTGRIGKITLLTSYINIAQRQIDTEPFGARYKEANHKANAELAKILQPIITACNNWVKSKELPNSFLYHIKDTSLAATSESEYKEYVPQYGDPSDLTDLPPVIAFPKLKAFLGVLGFALLATVVTAAAWSIWPPAGIALTPKAIAAWGGLISLGAGLAGGIIENCCPCGADSAVEDKEQQSDRQSTLSGSPHAHLQQLSPRTRDADKGLSSKFADETGKLKEKMSAENASNTSYLDSFLAFFSSPAVTVAASPAAAARNAARGDKVADADVHYRAPQ